MIKLSFTLNPHCCFVLMPLICILSFFINTKAIAVNENRKVTFKHTFAGKKPSGPYCGVSCLYSVIKLSGRQISFKDLLRPEYIESHKGSSLLGLRKAGEDNGMYAVPLRKLTTRILSHSPHPVILRVKSDITSQKYDHYELFLGAENGKAKLLNPPEPVKLVTFAELAPRSDGNGLIVSAEPIDLGAIFKPARKRFIMYVAVAIAAILAIHWAKRRLPETLLNSRRKLFGLSVGQGIVFAIAALLCGTFYHFANDEGLLANANATASIQQAHLGNFIPKVSEKEVHKLLDSDTIFIDARFARDFKAGHLKGAINVPVDANDVEHQKVTADIAKDARIVLYCQSAGCKFAEKVAIKLMADGFYDISIFRGGWNEWVAKNGKPKEVGI